MLSLALLLAVTTVDANSAGLITEIVTSSIAKNTKLDVISGADVRRQMEVEANKELLGCDASSASCLAELANAMGARFIVYGKLGTLDDVVILTLNVFDSEKAQAAGRVVAKDKSLAALAERAEPAALELVTNVAAGVAEGAKARVLVLDIEAPKPGEAAPPATPTATNEPLPALFWVGTGVAVSGAVVAVVGAIFMNDAFTKDKALERGPNEVDAIQAVELVAARDTSGTWGLSLLGLGGVALVGGGGVLVYGMME